MHRHLAGLVAAMALMTSSAIADGLRHRAPARCCETAPSWSGFYIGAGIGAGAVVHDLTVSAPGVTVLNFDGVGGEGVFGTVTVGYDRQFGNWVGGVFFDYDFSSISTDLSIPIARFSTSLDHEHSWSIGGRLGFLSSPSTLWYATAGYTQASFDDINLGFTSLSVPDFSGYFVGGGVESRLGGNWSLRAEYRFTQLDSETIFRSSANEGEEVSSIRVDLEPSMHTARVVLTYRFGDRIEQPSPMK